MGGVALKELEPSAEVDEAFFEAELSGEDDIGAVANPEDAEEGILALIHPDVVLLEVVVAKDAGCPEILVVTPDIPELCPVEPKVDVGMQSFSAADALGNVEKAASEDPGEDLEVPVEGAVGMVGIIGRSLEVGVVDAAGNAAGGQEGGPANSDLPEHPRRPFLVEEAVESLQAEAVNADEELGKDAEYSNAGRDEVTLDLAGVETHGWACELHGFLNKTGIHYFIIIEILHCKSARKDHAADDCSFKVGNGV